MYLENNTSEGLYTKYRVDLLSVLTNQMAISIENIHFFNLQRQNERLRYYYY